MYVIQPLKRKSWAKLYKVWHIIIANITWPYSQSYDFSSSRVWMWELDHKESWAPKNWCFWTMVLEKTPESPLDCKEIKPVHLQEIGPEYSLEGLMLKLKPQYFGHLMWRTDSFEKTLMLGNIEGRRRRDDRGWDGWMASPTQWTWVWVSSGSRWWTGKPGVLHTVHGVSKSKTQLSDWTELNITCNMFAIKMLLMPQTFQFTIETEKQFTNYLLFALDFIYLSALNLKYLYF